MIAVTASSQTIRGDQPEHAFTTNLRGGECQSVELVAFEEEFGIGMDEDEARRWTVGDAVACQGLRAARHRCLNQSTRRKARSSGLQIGVEPDWRRAPGEQIGVGEVSLTAKFMQF